MNSKKKDLLILTLLLIIFLAVNYPFLDSKLERALLGQETQTVFISRVIDGDTVASNNLNQSIRLLGINSPERGEPYYEEAKAFLEALILNRSVTLEFTGQRTDKYQRTLAYIISNNQNINIQLVEQGLANPYQYSGKDKYSNQIQAAWQTCLQNQINLCTPSTHDCANCIALSQNKITNSCPFACNLAGWTIKGEGRDKITFNQTLPPKESLEFDLDLTNSGGSLYLRDDLGFLVI